MASIFDPPAAARTFNASDWLAAIDVQLQAPPRARADEEPIIAESPPYRVPPADDEPLPTWATEPATQPAAAPRRLRNWHVAIVYAMIHGGLVTAVVGLASASTTLGLLSLAIHSAALLIGLAVGIPLNRSR